MEQLNFGGWRWGSCQVFPILYIDWSDRTWTDQLERGGGHKKRFQYRTDSTGGEIFNFEPSKVIQEKIQLVHLYRTMC